MTDSRALARRRDGEPIPDCYGNFDVRKDAQPIYKTKQAGFWRLLEYEDADECAAMGDGYSFHALGLEIEVYWFWDGDGTLAFLIGDSEPLRCVVNTDCKCARMKLCGTT